MTDNDKALVERLRSYNPFAYDEKTGVLPVLGTPYLDAADRIEAQAAEIERLKREVMLQMGWKTEAQNEVERLREALERIALGWNITLDDEDGPVHEWLDAEDLSEIARAALGETE